MDSCLSWKTTYVVSKDMLSKCRYVTRGAGWVFKVCWSWNILSTLASHRCWSGSHASVMSCCDQLGNSSKNQHLQPRATCAMLRPCISRDQVIATTKIGGIVIEQDSVHTVKQGSLRPILASMLVRCENCSSMTHIVRAQEKYWRFKSIEKGSPNMMPSSNKVVVRVSVSNLSSKTSCLFLNGRTWEIEADRLSVHPRNKCRRLRNPHERH